MPKNTSKIVHSFDVFDTILTRKVIQPTALFLIVGGRLIEQGLLLESAQTYRDLRVHIEKEARKIHPEAETTFEYIVELIADELKLTQEQKRLIKKVELDCELEHLAVVKNGLKLVKASRQYADEIIFTTDMYFSEHCIRHFLSNKNVILESEKIYSSSNHGTSKSTGGLYKKIANDYPSTAQFTHFGDNLLSDIKMARRAGWTAVPVRDAVPNQYESLLPTQVNCLSWQLLLGELRLRRLDREAELSGNAQSMYTIGLEVLGPLLTAYTESVQQWCEKDKIEHLFCLARDGQIIKIVFDLFLKHSYELPENTYLYASRRALRTTEYALTNEIPEWILSENDGLTLDELGKRLFINVKTCLESLEAFNIDITKPLKQLTAAEIETVSEWMKTSNFQLLYKKSSECSLIAATAYFKHHGLTTNKKTALCDVGWLGTMQNSVNAILSHASEAKLTTKSYLIGSKIKSSDTIKPTPHALLDINDPLCRTLCFPEILELCLSADHGGVSNYILTDTGPMAKLESIHNDEAIKRDLDKLRLGVTDFVTSYLGSTACMRTETKHSITLEFAKRNFYTLMHTPTNEEAEVFGSWPMSRNVSHNGALKLAPKLSLRQALVHGVRASISNRYYWMPGFAKRNGKIKTLIFRVSRKLSKLVLDNFRPK